MAPNSRLRRNPVPAKLKTDLWGAQSLIARVLGVSRQSVGRVWHGVIASRRIEAEIQKFLRDPSAYRRKYQRRAA